MEEPLLQENKKNNDQPQEINYLKTLLWKNYIVYKRNTGKMIFLILGPILINFTIFLCQQLINSQKRHTAPIDPPLQEVQKQLPHCYDEVNNPDCVSLSYGITGENEEWVDYTVQNLQKYNQFNDQEINQAFQSDGLSAKLISPYNQYLKQNPGKIQIAVEFCTGYKAFINVQRQIPVYLSNCNDLSLYVPTLNQEHDDHDDEEDENEQNILKQQNNQFFQEFQQNDFNYKQIQQNKNNTNSQQQNQNYDNIENQQNFEQNEIEDQYIQKFDNSLYYIIHMNMTEIQKGENNYNYNSKGIILKNQIDNILANYIKKKKENIQDNQFFSGTQEQNSINSGLKQYIDFDTSSFPGIEDDRIQKTPNLSQQLGQFWFIIVPLYLFYMILSDLLQEKEKKLRIGISILGVPHYKYWLSWIITTLILALFVSVYTILINMLFQFDMFLVTPFFMLFIWYFTFLLSLIAVSFFFATIFDNQKSGMACGIGFVLVACVIEMLIGYTTTLDLIYQKDPEPLFIFAQIFLDLFSPFNYTKMYQEMKLKSETKYDSTLNEWVKKDGMTWKEFTERSTGKKLGKFYERPSALESLILLFFNILGYVILAIYFDNYLDQNRGIGKPWHLNIFKKKQKDIQKNSNKDTSQIQNESNLKYIDLKGINYQNNTTIVSENSLQLKSLNPQNFQINQSLGVSINNVSKTFIKKSIFYYCTKKNNKKRVKITNALKNVNIQIQNDNICGFLGHSGAGKTTLINILTGIMGYEEGNIQINGVELNEDNVQKLRKKIGFCPQFDVIWDQLTPREHIELFCKIKGINHQEQIDEIIQQKLKMVSLLKVENSQSGGFSGGMKRRLSLVIATIGNPDIIFLDEPTNAMDPKSKREAWKLIQNCKKDKSILLTTHSMEEADILSDKIVILSQGEVLCQGSTQELKQQHGKGDRFYVVTKKNTDNTFAISQIEEEFDIEIEDFAGNSLIFCIPSKEQQQQLFIFLDKSDDDPSLSEQQQYIKSFIDDWGFSNATIEDVFLKVTKGHRESKKSFINDHCSLIKSKISN